MRGQVEQVQRIAVQSEETAKSAGMPEYIGTARANLSWAAWCRGDLADTQAKGLAALDQWGKIPAGHASCAFEWTALLPLMAVAVANRQSDQAIGYARALLDPAKQRLPDVLEKALEKAIYSWEEHPSDTILEQFNEVLAHARKNRYL
jgi:hypothetical protein